MAVSVLYVNCITFRSMAIPEKSGDRIYEKQNPLEGEWKREVAEKPLDYIKKNRDVYLKIRRVRTKTMIFIWE